MNITIAASAMIAVSIAFCGKAGAVDVDRPIMASFAGSSLPSNRDIGVIAATRALDSLGHSGGFYLTQQYHIPLPPELKDAVSVMTANYSGALAYTLERSLNRAAENAVGIGRAEFLAAVSARDIPVNQSPKSTSPVTDGLRGQATARLLSALKPQFRISLELAGMGAALYAFEQRYEHVTKAALPQVDFDSYLARKTVNTFFDAMANEEIKIRQLPSERPVTMTKPDGQ